MSIAASPAAKSTQAGRDPKRALALGCLVLLALGAQSAGAACGSTTSVTDRITFNHAIRDFNAVTTSPCVFTIVVEDDIDLNDGLETIQNTTSGVSLLIEGDGFQVDGQGFSGVRPFRIEANTVVTINELTVTGGKSIGPGPDFRGGGILNRGALTLNRSTVAGNSTQLRGGGIANNGGTLLITASTISGNAATGEGSTAGVGGGIYTEGGSVTVRNSTISGNDATPRASNRAFGGGIWADGDVTLDTATITDNFASEGSGFYTRTVQPRVLTIGNTILALNISTFYDCQIDNSGASVNDLGYNVFGGSINCGFVDGVNNNISANPGLEPLADNGGPTKTHALAPLSPAIDAGNSVLTTDQRGDIRPAGAAPDIGAFESRNCEGADWTASNQDGMNEAIACFNAKTDPDTYTITLVHGLGLTARLTAIDNPTPGVDLIIYGRGESIDGNGDTFFDLRPLTINADTTVTINDLEVLNGSVTGTERGGAIRNLGDLTLNRCTVKDSHSENAGAGISNEGTMAINDSTIAFNEANGGTSGDGGGISNIGDLTIKNSTISNNTASEDGGGIATSSGTLDLDSVTVTANTVSGGTSNGAGLAAVSGTVVSIRNSILAGNSGNEDCFVSVGPLTDNGHNLVQTQDNCGFVDGDNNNIVGTDPELGTLSRNGGPTLTHALLTGSPAIDTGDTSLSTDQRGQPRPAGAADDIGAYEGGLLGTITVRKETVEKKTTDYEFTLDGGELPSPIDFILRDNDAETFELAEGDYSVTEIVTGFVEPVNIVCFDDDGRIGSFAGNSADVSLVPRQNITCRFFNAHVCDVTLDGAVSKADIVLISRSLRSTVHVGTNGDINNDGRITTQDTRGCALQCTLERCAEPTDP